MGCHLACIVLFCLPLDEQNLLVCPICASASQPRRQVKRNPLHGLGLLSELRVNSLYGSKANQQPEKESLYCWWSNTINKKNDTGCLFNHVVALVVVVFTGSGWIMLHFQDRGCCQLLLSRTNCCKNYTLIPKELPLVSESYCSFELTSKQRLGSTMDLSAGDGTSNGRATI